MFYTYEKKSQWNPFLCMLTKNLMYKLFLHVSFPQDSLHGCLLTRMEGSLAKEPSTVNYVLADWNMMCLTYYLQAVVGWQVFACRRGKAEHSAFLSASQDTARSSSIWSTSYAQPNFWAFSSAVTHDEKGLEISLSSLKFPECIYHSSHRGDRGNVTKWSHACTVCISFLRSPVSAG